MNSCAFKLSKPETQKLSNALETEAKILYGNKQETFAHMRIDCNCCGGTHKAQGHLIYSEGSDGYKIIAVAHCQKLERKVVAYHVFTDFDKLGPRRFVSKIKDVMPIMAELANKAQYIKPLTRLDDGLRDTRAKAIVGEATLLMSKDPADVSKRIIRMFG